MCSGSPAVSVGCNTVFVGSRTVCRVCDGVCWERDPCLGGNCRAGCSSAAVA